MTGDQISSGSRCPSADIMAIDTAFLAGGRLLVGCARQDPASISILDVEKGVLAWTRTDPKGTQHFAAGSHVYLILPVDKAAGALSSAERHFTLNCLDGATGAVLWTSPLEDWLSESDRNGSLGPDTSKVMENTNAIPGHPHTVFVNRAGATLFDADTGKEMWHGKADSSISQYGGYGLSLGGKDLENGDWVPTGTSVLTGEQTWILPHAMESGVSATASGPLRIVVNSRIFAYDVRTGSVVANSKFPGTSYESLVSRDWLLVQSEDKKKLRLYRFGQWDHPLWEITTEATPSVLLPNVIILDGPRGLVLLDPQKGTVRAEATDTALYGVGGNSIGAPPNYGLGLLKNGSVIQLDTDLETPNPLETP